MSLQLTRVVNGQAINEVKQGFRQMGNTNPLNPNVNFSFLLGWVVANILCLPALLLPYGIGYFLVGSFVFIGDGMPIGLTGYTFIFINLALRGAMIGAWVGFMQSLPLKAQILQSGKWIRASSLGVASGAPIGWLAHSWFLESPIVNRPDGIHVIYFSSVYAYVIFGVLLGLQLVRHSGPSYGSKSMEQDGG